MLGYFLLLNMLNGCGLFIVIEAINMILALCLVYEMNVMQPKKVGPILPFAAPHYFDRCWG